MLDVLRGFALLGILLVNFPGGVSGWQGLDRAVMLGLNLLVRGSFYPLFSLLFGIGIVMQTERWATRRAAGIDLHIRRMSVLLLLGTIHAILIWSGDILVDYALFGFLVVPLRALGRRALLVAVIALAIVQLEGSRRQSAAMVTAREAPVAIEAALAAGARELAASDQRDELMASRGTVRGDIVARWWQYVGKVASFTRWRDVVGRDVLLLFVLGMLLGRVILERRQASAIAGRSLFVAISIALAVAIAGNVYLRVSGTGPLEVRRVAFIAANLGVTALLTCTVWALVLNEGRWAGRLRALAPAGRMALTNYLLQSLVMTWLFAPWGVGIGRPGAAASVGVGVGFFFWVQIPLSNWWLQNFTYGPVEWAWRSLTYGAPQPLQSHRS